MGRVIYQPRGKAREYADLALNLYAGCAHACRYCYAPAVLRKTREKFTANPRPRPGVLDALRKDAELYAGDPREVLLSFTSDPYQPCEAVHRLTRQALEILTAHRVPWSVLTKNPGLALRDLPLFRQGGASLGVTLVFESTTDTAHWEPGAPPPAERVAALKAFYGAGVPTWVSLEPVIDPAQSLRLIDQLHPWVTRWKVGKLNHDPQREAAVDWRRFARAAVERFKAVNADYYVKKSLTLYL